MKIVDPTQPGPILLLEELGTDLGRIVARAAPLFEELRGARLFLTGGTGFFGRWLLASFVEANRRMNLGAEAVVLSRDPARWRAMHPDVAKAPGIGWVTGDIRNFPWPGGGFTHVLHAATDTSVAAARQPRQLSDSIIGGTARTLDFAVAAGARKFLMTSSGAVYGKQPPHLTHLPEDFPGTSDPLHPGSTYEIAKRAAETLCAIAQREGRIDTTIARCFAFVGPYLPFRAHFAIGNFIHDALSGDAITLVGDGSPVRSYLYAADMALWLWTILLRGQSGRAYNVGSDEAMPLRDLAVRAAAAAGGNKPVRILGRDTGSFRNAYVPSIARAREELGLSPWTGLDDALRRTADWARWRGHYA